MAEDVTTGELSRNMAKLSTSMDNLATRLAEVPDWSDVRRVEAGLDKSIAAERLQRETGQAVQNLAIKTLEEGRQYQVRWFMGLLASSVLTLLGLVAAVATR